MKTFCNYVTYVSLNKIHVQFLTSVLRKEDVKVIKKHIPLQIASFYRLKKYIHKYWFWNLQYNQ